MQKWRLIFRLNDQIWRLASFYVECNLWRKTWLEKQKTGFRTYKFATTEGLFAKELFDPRVKLDLLGNNDDHDQHLDLIKFLKSFVVVVIDSIDDIVLVGLRTFQAIFPKQPCHWMSYFDKKRGKNNNPAAVFLGMKICKHFYKFFHENLLGQQFASQDISGLAK